MEGGVEGTGGEREVSGRLLVLMLLPSLVRSWFNYNEISTLAVGAFSGLVNLRTL
jgi:hypothetical protein